MTVQTHLLAEWLEETIADSLGPDWQPRNAALHIMQHFSDWPYRIRLIRSENGDIMVQGNDL